MATASAPHGTRWEQPVTGDTGDGNTRPPRKSIFPRRSVAFKERAGEVFQSRAPKKDADGNIQDLQKPEITLSNEKQRGMALLIWGDCRVVARETFVSQ